MVVVNTTRVEFSCVTNSICHYILMRCNVYTVDYSVGGVNKWTTVKALNSKNAARIVTDAFKAASVLKVTFGDEWLTQG